MTLHQAYARCQAIAAAHYESFPVASRLVPARMRPHVAAVYVYARAADDFADEGDLPPADRLGHLAMWREYLQASAAPGFTAAAVATVSASDAQAIFVAVQDTAQRCGLDPVLLADLLSAFEQDVTQTRYDSWSDVLDYCRRSANPIGRLVLGIAGVHDAEAARQSDATCTALQLANFWQDLGQDWRRGRLYVPAEVLERYGAQTGALDQGTTDVPWRAAIDDVCGRTLQLFADGRGVCDAVHGRLRYELRATWLGGRRILDRTAAVRQQSLHDRPVLGAADLATIAAGALLWWRR
ncbi:MAG: squalene synthase HpnC [Luteitalea sp.]